MLNSLKDKMFPKDDLEIHKRVLAMFKEAVQGKDDSKIDPTSTKPAAIAEMYKAWTELEKAKINQNRDYQ